MSNLIYLTFWILSLIVWVFVLEAKDGFEIIKLPMIALSIFMIWFTSRNLYKDLKK